jgi:hypothetical protein
LYAFPQKLRYSRYPFALPRLDHGGGAQGQQTYHGANLEPPGAAVGKAQDVAVETVDYHQAKIRTSFRSEHGKLPRDLFESDPSPVVGGLVLMPVKLAVAIDRVQLLDTLNLPSQLGNLLTESSIYER